MSPQNHSDLLSAPLQIQGLRKIAIPTADGFTLIELNDIFHLKAEGSHTRISFEDRSKIESNKSLGYFEAELADEPFLRIHNSFLVNLNRIKSYVRSDEGYVILQNGKLITVSKSNKEKFLQYFKSRKEKLHLLCIPNIEAFSYVENKNILYLRSRKNHSFGTEIFLEDKTCYVSSKNIGFYEQELAHKPFLRIHNSTIINLDKIRSYIRGDNTYVAMNNSEVLEVSKAKREQLLFFLKNGKKINDSKGQVMNDTG